MSRIPPVFSVLPCSIWEFDEITEAAYASEYGRILLIRIRRKQPSQPLLEPLFTLRTPVERWLPSFQEREREREREKKQMSQKDGMVGPFSLRTMQFRFGFPRWGFGVQGSQKQQRNPFEWILELQNKHPCRPGAGRPNGLQRVAQVLPQTRVLHWQEALKPQLHPRSKLDPVVEVRRCLRTWASRIQRPVLQALFLPRRLALNSCLWHWCRT